MIYDSTTNTYNLNNEEYFYNLEEIEETPVFIRAYFPKLLPHMKKDYGILRYNKTIDTNIFVNADDCKIKPKTLTAYIQNYITLRPHDNEYPNFRSKAYRKGNRYYVKPLKKFIADVLHGDVRNMYFTGKK